jgi:glycosyltransferase involved in cell wall biosynthesis
VRLLIFSPYFPPHVGGLEGFVSDLDDALIGAVESDEITVFTPRLPASAPRRESRADGYDVVRYPAFELIPNFPVPKVWSPEWVRALRSLEMRSFDVFVSHTRFFLVSTLSLALARLLRRPLVHVEHGSDFVALDRRATRLAARVYDLLLGRLLLRRADAVVAISDAAARFVLELSGRRAIVIRRGIWRERLEAVAPDEQMLAWADGARLVTFAGRLIDGKGVADLVEAFAQIEDESVKLCIVGDGPRKAHLEALAARLGVADRVLFLGDVPEARAWAAIRATTILVNPSYTEGLGSSVLEAAVLARPVIATDIGGHPEVIVDGEGGYLVPPRDCARLRGRLEELLSDPDLCLKLGVGARAGVLDRFDWDVSAARFRAVAADVVVGRAKDTQTTQAPVPESTSSNTDS